MILQDLPRSDGKLGKGFMDAVDQLQIDLEAQRMQTCREELVERIMRTIPEDGVAEPLPGLHLARASIPLKQVHGAMAPSFCVIAQGSKEILFGDSRSDTTPFITYSLPLSCPASVGCWKHPRIAHT
jgi:AraC-type transcriptional regulator N-terminus